MNQIQFESLSKQDRSPQLATAQALTDQTPRTLTYGYTCSRETFHVYLAEDGIHRVVYDGDGLLLSHVAEPAGLPLEHCVPDKRLYPEACDYEFCLLLTRAGVSLPFTTWNDRREPKVFHGQRLEELFAKYRPADFKLAPGLFEELVATEVFGGSEFLEEAVVAILAELMQQVAESYLRASIPGLRAGAPGRAEAWLDNLPGSMDAAMTCAGYGAGELSAIQKLAAVNGVRARVQPRLQELLAR